MIQCQKFFNELTEAGLTFFTGVPDSLLKNFCFYVNDVLPEPNHIVAANEGSAVGLAVGYHMSTGRIPVVYLQNSGLGNTINPLLSIADPDVYSIPMLLLVGWRGEPGVKDEPQHKKQGRVMLEMLNSMEIPYAIIDGNSDVKACVDEAVQYMRENNKPFVSAVREGSFDEYEVVNKSQNKFPLTREAAIEQLLHVVGCDDVVVCTTGKASRELYELRVKREEFKSADFLTVGAMGHCSQIALGVALQKTDRKVFCFDGDGAVIMHMGGLVTIGRLAPKNFFHIMINNGAHESVGGQETGAFAVDWSDVAKACGYQAAVVAENADELKAAIEKLKGADGPVFLEVRTSQGSRKDLGRPKSSPLENKEQFMKALL